MAHISDHITEAANSAADATIAAVSSKTTYAGAGITLSGWWTSNEFLGLAGLLVATLSFVTNWYYKHKLTRAEIRLMEEAAQRDREEHAAKMELYR